MVVRTGGSFFGGWGIPSKTWAISLLCELDSRVVLKGVPVGVSTCEPGRREHKKVGG